MPSQNDRAMPPAPTMANTTARPQQSPGRTTDASPAPLGTAFRRPHFTTISTAPSASRSGGWASAANASSQSFARLFSTSNPNSPASQIPSDGAATPTRKWHAAASPLDPRPRPVPQLPKGLPGCQDPEGRRPAPCPISSDHPGRDHPRWPHAPGRCREGGL
jgi:hypothetical protein